MVERRRETVTLNLRIDPTLKAAVERAATADHRFLTSLIEKILAEYLKTKRYLRGAR
jgi:hypothetical protein